MRASVRAANAAGTSMAVCVSLLATASNTLL
jgi:hypothetical protein